MTAVLAVVGLAGCGGGDVAGGDPVCAEVLAKGAVAPDGVDWCINSQGERAGIVTASWDCDDGGVLVATGPAWWFAGETVHLEADTGDAPPADVFRECRGL